MRGQPGRSRRLAPRGAIEMSRGSMSLRMQPRVREPNFPTPWKGGGIGRGHLRPLNEWHCLSQRDRLHPVRHLPPPRINVAPRSFTGVVRLERMFAIGMNSEAWHRKNDGVLECARQSAASTPLWSCPKRQTHSLPISIPISSTASREESRNPQRGDLRAVKLMPVRFVRWFPV